MTLEEAKIEKDLYQTIVGGDEYTLRGINVIITKIFIDEPIKDIFEVIIVGKKDTDKNKFIYGIKSELLKPQ